MGVYLVTEYASKGDVFGELDRRGGSMTEADAVRQVRGKLAGMHIRMLRETTAQPSGPYTRMRGAPRWAGEQSAHGDAY